MTNTAFDSSTFLETLTHKPGVYRMLDEDGGILYVGKARNLKNRVSSYFRGKQLETKTLALVDKIRNVEVTVTASETEALLLEQSLIKQERPPYNVVLRDDKSYPYIYLTDDAYPRLTFHRGAKRKTGRYFGPFPSASAVRESLNLLQKLFRIRQCDNTFFKNRSRPCLQYQIQRCSGPCVDLIEPEHYAEDVELAVLFLDGRSQQVRDTFKEKMLLASEVHDYERAAKFRDQIAQLGKVQEQQSVHGRGGDVDVFAFAQASGVDCVQALFVRDGRLLGQRTWFPKNRLDLNAPECLGAFISQYYLGSAHREVPRSVVTSIAVPESEILADALSRSAKRQVDIAHRVRGQRARWLDLATENATHSLNAYVADKRNIYARFVELQESLDLDDVPRRLECFDVSHTQGEATVASCVVFDRNGPLKSDYRRFNIKDVTGGDDYAAMEQALRRRYTRLRQGEGEMPDLLVIDGGVGQLRRAEQVLTELQVDSVPLLGIAKGPARRPDLETYWTPEGQVTLSPSGGAIHLLQQIRDEAHRFAITAHPAATRKSPARHQNSTRFQA